MDEETRMRFGFGAPSQAGAIGGYMSDSSAVRMPNWAMRGEFQMFETVEDDEEEEDDAHASALRQLSGVGGASVQVAKQRPLNPVSWTALEFSCRKLDAAQIPISSIDLTYMEEEEGFMDQFQSLGLDTPQEDEVQFDNNHMYQQTSTGRRKYPPMDPNDVEVSYSFNLPKEDPIPEEEEAQDSLHAPPTAQHKSNAAMPHCGSAASSPALSENPKNLIRIPSSGSGSFISSPASSVAARRSMSSNSGDIFGSGAMQPSLGGGPERTTSGLWSSTNSCNAANGVFQGTRLKSQGPSSFPGQPEPRVIEPRLAQDLFLSKQQEKETEKEKEREVPYNKYSSLILPGAVPRDAKANVGVRRYIRAVKSKCGELFSSSSARKTKVQS